MTRSLALVLLTAFAGAVQGAAPPNPPEPLRGAVVSGNALVCARGGQWGPELRAWLQPLKGGRASEVWLIVFATHLPLRWHAAHGALWVADCWGPLGGVRHVGELAVRYELAELLKSRRVIGPGAKESEWLKYFIPVAEAVHDARFMGVGADFEAQVHYDYLPTGANALKLFVLTNVEGRGEPAGKAGSLSARRFPAKAGKLKWSFSCLSARARWNASRSAWQPEDWKEEGTLELCFREPFQALARGEDYYFLTASGRLFRAPKPAKGTHRKLEAVWAEPRSPVVAFVTDADRGRAFQFCERGPRGAGGPCVFELASGARPRFYDKALFRPGEEGPPALRKVVGYARVLQALGHVKAKP